MSVKELIAELSKIKDQDKDIYICDPDHDSHGNLSWNDDYSYTSDFKVEKSGSEKWGYSYNLVAK